MCLLCLLEITFFVPSDCARRLILTVRDFSFCSRRKCHAPEIMREQKSRNKLVWQPLLDSLHCKTNMALHKSNKKKINFFIYSAVCYFGENSIFYNYNCSVEILYNKNGFGRRPAKITLGGHLFINSHCPPSNFGRKQQWTINNLFIRTVVHSSMELVHSSRVRDLALFQARQQLFLNREFCGAWKI